MPSRRRYRAARALDILATASLALAAPAGATKEPAVLTPTFADRDLRQAAGWKPPPSVCTVNFVEITDGRRSRDLVGVIGKRAVQAPRDTQTWLRAVLSGLGARGITARFDAATGDAATPVAKFGLQMAAINDSVETYTANVLVSIDATGSKGRTLSRTYRGRAARTAYWSGGVDTLQSVMDGAFANALNAMAPDLKQLCPV